MDGLNSKVLYDKDFKIDVHVEPIDGLHMADYDFRCEFFVFAKRSVYLRKEDMIKVDEDNYIACISNDDARKLGRGLVMMTFHAEIPDGDFPDGYRADGVTVCTGVTIA